jgi:hypothetical protein
MPIPINNDNIYPVGTVVYSRVQPDLKLIIEQYMHRIYFCGVFLQPGSKQVPYFEREITDTIQPAIKQPPHSHF